jgi:hypothetical protein
MRKAINENPVVQIAVVGVLLLVVGFIVSTSVLKKDEGGSSSAAEPTPAATEPPASVSATAPTTGSSAAPVEASVTGVPALPAGEGPPLPRAVAEAYQAGDTIVLLVVRSGGVEDRMVRGAVEKLRGDGRVAVFVTRAEGIARYVRITQSVAVDRVPALVVVRPRWATGGTPEATVEYGFRDSRSVVQAVKDAVYQGRTVPYHPG